MPFSCLRRRSLRTSADNVPPQAAVVSPARDNGLADVIVQLARRESALERWEIDMDAKQRALEQWEWDLEAKQARMMQRAHHLGRHTRRFSMWVSKLTARENALELRAAAVRSWDHQLGTGPPTELKRRHSARF